MNVPDFAEIRADIVARLAEGGRNRRSPMHTPVIATADADARVMVLRAFDPESWTLRFHTDARSPKAALIGEEAPVGVLFYDPAAKLQIRARGAGRIELAGQVADAAWAESTPFARRCYMGEGPGTLSNGPTSGLPDWIEGVKPSEEQLVPARENFAVLLVTLEQVDWFSLSNDGHRRAIFDLVGGEGRWVTP